MPVLPGADYPTIVGWADRLGIRIVSAATEVPAYYTWTLLLPNGQPGPAISKSGGSLPNLDGAFVGLYKLFDSVVGEARLAAALAAPNVSESVRLAPELAAPMDAWLDAHGLVALQPVLSNLFSGFGYSHLWTVPAAYGLRFATPRMLLYLFSGVDAATAALGPGPWPNDVFVFEVRGLDRCRRGRFGSSPKLARVTRSPRRRSHSPAAVPGRPWVCSRA